jgi:hypothetical protein
VTSYITPAASIGLWNILTYGDFAAATGWVVGSGWTVSGGKASHASGTATLAQSVTVTTSIAASTVYELLFTVGDYASGKGLLGVTCGGTTVQAADSLHSGSYRYLFTTTNATGALIFTPSDTWTGSLDNVYLYRTAGPLTTGGGVRRRSEVKTGAYTITANDHVLTHSSGDAHVFTLPSLATAWNVYEYTGAEYCIYNQGAGILTVTIAALAADSGYNAIEGEDSLHLAAYEGVTIRAVSPTLWGIWGR